MRETSVKLRDSLATLSDSVRLCQDSVTFCIVQILGTPPKVQTKVDQKRSHKIIENQEAKKG